jgi:DNA-binding MarR family transcriptional regulator
VSLTEKGLKLLEKINPIVEEFEKKWVGKLNTEELQTLNNLLEKLRLD